MNGFRFFYHNTLRGDEVCSGNTAGSIGRDTGLKQSPQYTSCVCGLHFMGNQENTILGKRIGTTSQFIPRTDKRI
ncbi:hypothetical protein COY07_06260 [Candidatus Peregrinibacteria bacterium CG_4_10_14_0_2_um_filter_43_11]|nr:MAG: hypothetical protein COY07_06260 [Candidatus Peregrinibacteria bacterium CG_4_10_14_0_2_um_filter_43_11]